MAPARACGLCSQVTQSAIAYRNRVEINPARPTPAISGRYPQPANAIGAGRSTAARRAALGECAEAAYLLLPVNRKFGGAMAGGWARDGAVNDQIDVSTREAIERMRQRNAHRAAGESAAFCDNCDEPIPEARRAAIAGVRLCVDCQSGRDKTFRAQGGINRRGSKDSQLR